MSKWVHSDVLDGGLNAIKNGAIRMLLIKAYTAADSYATVTGNKIAEATMASTDFVITTSGSNRTLTTAADKVGTSTAASAQYDSGTATGGTTSTLADTSKSWTTNVHAGRAVKITSGTGAGQRGRIFSNTGTVLTIDTAWASSPDATSVYRITDDLHLAFTDNSAKVLWVTDETSEQVVESGNPIAFPQVATTAFQPT